MGDGVGWSPTPEMGGLGWHLEGQTNPTVDSAGAEVRAVDLPRLTQGVLHTKFWLVDGTHLYVGSANMDWRSLTQVSYRRAPVPNRCQGYPQTNTPPPQLRPGMLGGGIYAVAGGWRHRPSSAVTVLLAAGEGTRRCRLQLQLLGSRLGQNL